MGLTLLRHPPVSASGICYGRHEMRLRPGHAGVIAQAVRDTPRPAELLTSPALRCRGLAAALAAAHGLEAQVDERLAELDFGAWEGRAWAQIPRAQSDHWAEDPVNRAPPGGESFAALSARVRAALAGRQDAAVVTHAGPIRAVMIMAGTTDFATAFAKPVPYASPIALPPLPG